MYNLFIDDERNPVVSGWKKVVAAICAVFGVTLFPGWKVVRSYDEAIACMKMHGCPVFVSFDHDLGIGKDGYDIAKWMVEQDMDNPGWMPENFHYYVHSQNPVGKANISQYLNTYLMYRSD